MVSSAIGRHGARPVGGVAVRLFLTAWLLFALHFATNTVREIYPALSLGDHLSFDVSEYQGLHPDIFEVPGRGTFINNNPGASILGAIPYGVSRPIIDAATERVLRARAVSSAPAPEYDSIYPMAREFFRQAYERGLDVKFGLAAGVIQVGLMAPLSALSVVVMFRLLWSLTSRLVASILLALLYGFATPVLFRTAQLNQNLLITDFALFAFALLWRPWEKPTRSRPLSYLVAGLLCGWAVVLDYSGVIVVVVLGGYAAWRRSALAASTKTRGDLPLFLVGVGASLLVLLGYQWSAFGHPLFPAQRYMPPTRYSVLGYHGLTWPQLDLLWQTAFGIRFGLFTSAPLLLLSLYPPAWTRRVRLVGRREAWTILVFTVSFFLFCAANQYGRLQFNSGVRYIVPVVPFLFLIVAGALLYAADFLLQRPLRKSSPLAAAHPWIRLWPLAVFVAVTVYWSWSLAMYRDVERGYGVLEAVLQVTTRGLRLPWLATMQNMGYIPAGPWAWLVFLLASLAIWVIWRIRRPALSG